MKTDRKLTLFHAPRSRSSGSLVLLEEIGAPYELQILNLKLGEQRKPAYLKVNPLGKVPALLDGDALITEQVAIYLYLADLFPEARLAPVIGDRLRGPYLRWMAYYAACYEPALVDKAMQREPGPLTMSPYGDFDTMLATVRAQLAGAPYLLGDEFTAADILWGMALNWGTMFKLVPEDEVFAAYVKRVTERPSSVKVAAMDAEWAAEQEAAMARVQA
jgi:glutathione S-transferase